VFLLNVLRLSIYNAYNYSVSVAGRSDQQAEFRSCFLSRSLVRSLARIRIRIRIRTYIYCLYIHISIYSIYLFIYTRGAVNYSTLIIRLDIASRADIREIRTLLLRQGCTLQGSWEKLSNPDQSAGCRTLSQKVRKIRRQETFVDHEA